ncbi:MAG: HD-GYP domain-containing protein, partial [Rubripirellula sp.]
HCGIGSEIMNPHADDIDPTVREHATIGSKILGSTRSPLLKLAAIIAGSHHEKWDGSGYPHGLSGEEIPIEGRIVAVADVFDALSSSRPYKEAFPISKCIEILEQGRGKHFDPAVLDAFQRKQDEIIAVQQEYVDHQRANQKHSAE